MQAYEIVFRYSCKMHTIRSVHLLSIEEAEHTNPLMEVFPIYHNMLGVGVGG